MTEVLRKPVSDQVSPHTCAERIAQYVAHASRDHPAAIQVAAQRALADTLGCMILGAHHPDTRAVLAMVAPWGQGQRPVYGCGARLPAPWAALVNGTSAHAYDFDDWEDPGITHGSAAVLPALLALAEDTVPLNALWDAWIIGTEVIMRMGQAVNMTHYELGWHTTNTLGAIGAAAACARLTALDVSQTAHAISVSTSMIGGFTSQFGTTAKPLHAGLAAKTGVMAAALAAQNATAQTAIFEEEAGFLNAMTRATPARLQSCLAELGHSYAIAQFGLHVKKYPSCGCTHLVIEACQKMLAQQDLNPQDIVRVDTVISDIARSVLPYGVPKNRTEALFSVPWCAAAAFIDGTVGVATFQPSALARADLLDLSARISVAEHPRAPGLAFHPDFPDMVTVHLKDGRSFSETVAYPPGSPQRPLPIDDLRTKFLSNTEMGQVSQPKAELLFDRLFDSPTAMNVGDLVID